MDPGLPDPTLIGFDLDASNGVVHVLDGVLLPLSVSAILTQPDTDFEIDNGSNERFQTGRGNDFVDGNGGGDVIRTGSGNDVAIGGAGNDWMFGGGGHDDFVFENGSGRDVVLGFSDGSDQIDVSGYEGIENLSDIEDGMQGRWYGTRINLEDGDSILLVGVSEHRLDESDFIFA